MADERMGIALNLSNKAASQYRNYDFNSMCYFHDGQCWIGADSTGIFKIFQGADDNETDIDAYFILPTTDLGIQNEKRIRAMYAGAESDGSIKVSLKFDDGSWVDFTATPAGTSNLQRGVMVYGKYTGQGMFVSTKISNVSGSDFGIDRLRITPIVLRRRVSGS